MIYFHMTNVCKLVNIQNHHHYPTWQVLPHRHMDLRFPGKFKRIGQSKLEISDLL